MISSLPAVRYGTLYYRYLEMDKITTLKQSKGDFEAMSRQGISEMRWLDNLDSSYNTICHPPVDIFCFQMLPLWAGGHHEHDFNRREMVTLEAENNINYLEHLAASLSLDVFIIQFQENM